MKPIPIEEIVRDAVKVVKENGKSCVVIANGSIDDTKLLISKLNEELKRAMPSKPIEEVKINSYLDVEQLKNSIAKDGRYLYLVEDYFYLFRDVEGSYVINADDCLFQSE